MVENKNFLWYRNKRVIINLFTIEVYMKSYYNEIPVAYPPELSKAILVNPPNLLCLVVSIRTRTFYFPSHRR